jgi:hypothetical protein
MHGRAILAVARKDALDLWLNKSTLAGLLFPIIRSLVWLLISKAVGKNQTGTLVYNPGQSNVAQVAMATFPSPQLAQASSAEQVRGGFASSQAVKASGHAVGMIVPADFDQSLRSGAQPELQLFVDGSAVPPPTQALLEAAITNYGRAVASPQPPLNLMAAVVNRPAATNAGVKLAQVCTSLALLLSLVVGTTFVPQLLIEEKEKGSPAVHGGSSGIMLGAARGHPRAAFHVKRSQWTGQRAGRQLA